MFGKFKVSVPDFEQAPLHTESSLRWMCYFLSPHQKLFAALTLNRMVRMIFYAGIQPLLFAKIFAAFEDGSAFQDPSIVWKTLWIYAGLSAIIYLLLLICAEESKLRERVGRSARLLGLSRISNLSMQWHEGSNSGGKLQKIMSGSQGLIRLIQNYFLNLLPVLADFLGTIIALLGMGLSPLYLFYITTFAITYLMFALWTGTRIARGYDTINDLLETLVGKVYEFINAPPMMKSFNLERHILTHAQIGEQEGYDHASPIYTRDYARWCIMNFIGLIWIIFISYMAAKQVLAKEIPIASFVLITYQVRYLWGTLERANNVYDQLLEDNSAFKRLILLLRQEPKKRKQPQKPPLRVPKGAITINNIQFSYNNRDKVFNGLTLRIKAGEKVGLVGASGAGKSSLVKLLLRFYDPTQNEILIDDQNISDVSTQSLRQQIALIPQDVNLFNHSIMDNIRYGRLDASDEEVIAAAQQADADRFIRALPDGYHTLVGERGLKLSGGQRQRIAIARAILKDAPILILDEATSALDAVAERSIQKRLKELMKGKTVIAIAHRLSTLLTMDRIIVLDQGQIIEEGSHDELLRRNEHYAKLWHMQSQGFIRNGRE